MKCRWWFGEWRAVVRGGGGLERGKWGFGRWREEGDKKQKRIKRMKRSKHPTQYLIYIYIHPVGWGFKKNRLTL